MSTENIKRLRRLNLLLLIILFTFTVFIGSIVVVYYVLGVLKESRGYNGERITYKVASISHHSGRKEFSCSGSCYCEDFRRRSIIAKKGTTMLYSVSALSLFIAWRKSEGILHEECSLEFEDCPEENIRSEVSDCRMATEAEGDGEEKARLATSFDILKRLRYDPQFSLNQEQIQVVYVDRFQGTNEISLMAFQLSDIPIHRVVQIKINGEVVWDRKLRIDLVSGGTAGQFLKDVEENDWEEKAELEDTLAKFREKALKMSDER